jgi:hypothetical protein
MIIKGFKKARFVGLDTKNDCFTPSKWQLSTATGEKLYIVSDGTSPYQNSRRSFEVFKWDRK